MDSMADTQRGLLNTMFALKTLLQQGRSEPVFYDLVYKFKKNVGMPTFTDHLNHQTL